MKVNKIINMKNIKLLNEVMVNGGLNYEDLKVAKFLGY